MSGSTYTFPRSAFVGFDHLFNELNRVSLREDTYPPHNVVFIDDDNFLVEIAVAGFSKKNLDIQLKDSILTVSGEMKDDRIYNHKGISTRKFTRTFTLSEYVQVKGADLKNGILSISLTKVVPESERPKKIEIGSTFIRD
jgi:molecular chaperone IbpA